MVIAIRVGSHSDFMHNTFSLGRCFNERSAERKARSVFPAKAQKRLAAGNDTFGPIDCNIILSNLEKVGAPRYSLARFSFRFSLVFLITLISEDTPLE